MEFDLKAWRLGLGLTQQGAANLLGVHRVTYTRYETGAQELPKMLAMACVTLKGIMENSTLN